MALSDWLRPQFRNLPRGWRVTAILLPIAIGITVLCTSRSVGVSGYLQDRLMAIGVALMLMPLVIAFPLEQEPSDPRLTRVLRVLGYLVLAVLVAIGTMIAISLIAPEDALLDGAWPPWPRR